MTLYIEQVFRKGVKKQRKKNIGRAREREKKRERQKQREKEGERQEKAERHIYEKRRIDEKRQKRYIHNRYRCKKIVYFKSL